jgi:hypothetical protein
MPTITNKKKKPNPQLSEANVGALQADIKKRGGVEPALRDQLAGTPSERILAGQPSVPTQEQLPIQAPEQTPKFEEQIVTPTNQQAPDETPFQVGDIGDPLEETVKTIAGFGADPAGQIKREGAKVVGGAAGAAAASAALGAATFIPSIMTGSIGTAAATKTAQVATNPKTVQLTTSHLMRNLGIAAGAATTIAGLVGTVILGRFQLAETVDKYGIAIFRASQIGDEEAVERLSEEVSTITDPSVWEYIKSVTPIVSAFSGIDQNIRAAGISAQSILDTTEKEKESRAEESAEFNTQRTEQRQFEDFVFDLRQQGKDEEADAATNQRLKNLKGGK